MQHKHTTTCKSTPVQVECPVPPIHHRQHAHGRETLRARDNPEQRRRRLLLADRKSRLREGLRMSTLDVLMVQQEGSLQDIQSQTHFHTLLQPFHTVFRFIFTLTGPVLLSSHISCLFCQKTQQQVRGETDTSRNMTGYQTLQDFCALTVCVHPSSLMGIHLKISPCLLFQR